MAEQKKRGRPPKNKVEQSTQTVEVDEQLYEIAALSDFITQYGSGASLTDIKLTDLYTYLRNPYANIKQIRNASKYLTNKHGVVKDVLKTIKSLPTLNFHLAWSSFDNPKQIKKFEKKIYDFLDTLDVKKIVRHGLYEIGEVGTVVPCLRNGKYVQFLDLDDLRINRMRNDKWVVEYDLSKIKTIGMSTQDILQIIESLPEEVTVVAYNNYRSKGESARFVELKNCYVLGSENRNFPFGLPFSLGSWASLIQKEIISRTERSQADQLTKKLLILYAGNIGGKEGKPAPKPLIQEYFKSISDLIVKKEQQGKLSQSGELSGTGVATLPDFFELKELNVSVEMFTKDLYEKINADIFMNLGVSEALVYGSGANYSSSQVNSDKLFRYIFSLLEEFEIMINDFIKQLLPSTLQCKFYFERTTIIDKDKYIDKCRELYMQTGILSPWVESLLGVPYHYALGLAQYEQQILDISKIIKPAQNAYTSSGNESNPGRPENTDGAESDSNIRSKTSNGNKTPSPSD